MIRPTSVETYRQITAEGLLSRMRWLVYSRLYAACEYAPVTAQELAGAFPPADRESSVGLNLHARLGELRALGVVAEHDARECRVTGRRAITWATTDALPRKPEPKPTRLEAAQDTIRQMADTIRRQHRTIEHLERRLADCGCTPQRELF